MFSCRQLIKMNKKMEKAKKQLDKFVPDPATQTTSSPPASGKCHPIKDSATTRQDGDASQNNNPTEVTNMIRNLHIVHRTSDPTGDNSDSSCETLTSSSDGESDEDVRTIVNGSGNDGQIKTSGDHIPVSIEETGKSGDLFWKSGALFTLHSLGSEDKPIQSEEWIHFLVKTMKVICFMFALLQNKTRKLRC